MCGLAGFARLGGGPLAESRADVLHDMALAVAHRGPDGTRCLLEGPVALGFTRLSIVDPVGGGQPLANGDGSVVLIANGEVYNHRELEAGLPAGTRLRTKSDCEVLVHLYQRDGMRFLDDVRGIFAVVIWDRTRRRLVLARDRFGIKPLYFARHGNLITFASEIKAIFADPAVPRRVDWEACLADQMMTGAPRLDDTPPVSWFEGIEIVPAGSVVEIQLANGETRTHRYWSLPRPGGDADLSHDELVATYRDLLSGSVAESGMSDAEIGLFLSGGIDSTAVAAFSGALSTLHTFTALNGGTFVNGDGEAAHRVASVLGRPNHQILFGPERIPTCDEWKRLLWLLETPLCGPEQFYKYELHRFARATRPDLKVMLLGQASDEFNGGYSVQFAGGGDWSDFVESLRTMGRRRAFLEHGRLAPWWEHALPLLSEEPLRGHDDGALDDPYAAYVAWRYRHILQYNCWHEDRTAAGNGIEARPPFLDHRVVELTAAIPVSQRKRLLWDKQILREALRGVVPDELIDIAKNPFFYGSGERHVYRTFVRMLAQDDAALLEEALSGARARAFIDAEGARATLRRLQDNQGGVHVELLLHVVNVGLLEQMVAALPPPPSIWPAQPLPREREVTSWEAERREIEAELLPAPPLASDVVPAFAEDVLLVRAEPSDGRWFLVVDGSLEYVVDEEEERDWLKFLRAVDGTRDLGEILAETGCGLDAVRGMLNEAVDVGVLLLRPPMPAGDPDVPAAATPPAAP